jgi:two-component system, NarL family, sensor kinase
MRYTTITILLILNTCSFLSAQTTQDLVDSANNNRLKDYSKTIAFATAAYKQATQKKQYSLIAESAFRLGTGYYLAGKFDTALHWYFEAEQGYSNLKDTAGLCKLYTEMSVFYVKRKKFSEANEISNKAIQYAILSKDSALLSPALNDRGLMFLDQGMNDSAITFFQYSYNLCKELGDKVGMAYSRDYTASALVEKKDFVLAHKYMSESIELRKGAGDNTGEAIAINNLGELYKMEKKPKEAIPYFLEAVKKAHDMNFLDLEVYASNMLSEAYAEIGDYKKAYEAQQVSEKLNEKILSEKSIKAIEESQTAYKTKEKEAENKILEQKNETQAALLSKNKILLYAIILVSLLSLGLFYLLYNRYKLRQRAVFKEAMFEEQKMRAQGIMDAEENERQRLARELHDGVGQLLSAARRKIQMMQPDEQTLPLKPDDPLKLLDDSIKEVRDLSHSMMPPSLLNKDLKQAVEEFVGRISHSDTLSITTEWVNIDGLDLEKTVTLMLYRSIQEMVSNAIRHAKATAIHIEFVNHNTELTLMVYDDGIGFDKEKLLSSGKGMGLKNIQSRIAYIGGNLQIDTMPGKGTTYIIELPLHNS